MRMNNNFFSKFGQIRNEHYPWLYVTTETLGRTWGETPEITVETRLKYRKVHNNEMLMYVDIAFDLNKSIQEIIKYKKV